MFVASLYTCGLDQSVRPVWDLKSTATSGWMNPLYQLPNGRTLLRRRNPVAMLMSRPFRFDVFSVVDPDSRLRFAMFEDSRTFDPAWNTLRAIVSRLMPAFQPIRSSRIGLTGMYAPARRRAV